MHLSDWISSNNQIRELTLRINSPAVLTRLVLDVPLPHIQILRIELQWWLSEPDVGSPYDLLEALGPSAAGLRLLVLNARIDHDHSPASRARLLQIFKTASARRMLSVTIEELR
jgi:hypothetical protein